MDVLPLCALLLSLALTASCERRDSSLEIYKRLFETKRRDQLTALKNLVELNDVNQQYKIIDIMLKGLFKVLEDSRAVLIAANVQPDDAFPQEEKLKEGPGHKAGAIEGVQTQTPSSSEIRIVLFGKTGAGKSASGNTILGREEFEAKASSKSKTKKCVKRTGEVAGRRVAVVDTPGLYDTKISEEEIKIEIAKCIAQSAPGPHAFLLVIQLGRFTEEERKTVEIIKMIFCGKATNYIIILFTRGDDLEGQTMNQYVKDAEDHLKQLLMECGYRYHAFNNKEKNDRTQVTKLIEKIETMMTANNNTYYTSEMLQQVNKKIEERVIEIMKEKKMQIDRKREELKGKYQRELQEKMGKIEEGIQDEEREMRKKFLSVARERYPTLPPYVAGLGYEAGAKEGVQTQTPSHPEIRIVLFGKSGTGKSASGNTILGRKEFDSRVRSKSETKGCVKRTGEVAGRPVVVVDTLGLYDTEMSQKKVIYDAVQCISAPGPHVFLLVIQVGRFTEEEKKTVEIIKESFGGKATNYIMVLFTRVDDLEEGEAIEQYVKDAEDDLKQLLMECGYRYHAFNNKEKNDRTQVTKLIEKIEAMVTANNNTYYTTEMLQQVNEKIEKRIIEIMKEKKEQIDLEIEKLKAKYHAFNNREKNDRTQVTKLIEKIEAMVTANNTTYYTSEMLQQENEKTEKRVIEIMKKKKKQIDLEIEKLKGKYQRELQEKMRKIDEEIQDKEERETRERDNVRVGI
ncbi:UNVERIFIED_CONTAM: hypothetical protein FKN15_008961 [Acipenser sinensis]